MNALEPMGALEDDRTNPELLPAPKPLPVATIAGVNVEALLEKAVDAKAAVEVLERLMVMRRELAAEQAKAAFDRAMAAFQAECPVIVKSEVVHQKNSTAVRYRYAPLDVIVAQVKGLLEKHGLSHTETAQVEKEWVTAVCAVKHNQGHSEKSEFKVPIDPEAYMNAAQKFASALTFAKRYAFCNALGILTGDADDDSRASGEPTEVRKATHTASKAQNASNRASGASTTPSSASGPSQEAHKPSPPHSATPETRQKLIESLGMDMWNIATEYFRKLEKPSVLLPVENLSDLPLWAVPVTKRQFEDLKAAIVDFANGAEAKHAYPPNSDLPRTLDSTSPTPASDPAPQSSPGSDAKGEEPEPEWKSFPVPFGKNAGVPLGKILKATLWGFWANYTVETEYNGKAKKPETIAKDRKFREMLDEAGKYLNFQKKPE